MFTVFNTTNSDEVYGHNLTASDAMRIILSYENYQYRVVTDGDDGIFWLEAGSGCGDFGVLHTVGADDEESAREILAEEIISRSGGDWSKLEATPTDKYFDDLIQFYEEKLSYEDDEEIKVTFHEKITNLVDERESLREVANTGGKHV